MNTPSPKSDGKKLLLYSSPASSLGWRAMFKAKWSPALAFAIVSVVIGSWLAFAMAIRARNDLAKKEPRIHLIQDMDNQVKVKYQARSTLFADGRAERPPVLGTIARGRLQLDDHMHRGYSTDGDGKSVFFDGFPDDLKIDDDLLARGQKMFNISCSLCHGKDGYGNGPIHIRANKLAGVYGTSWVQPSNLHSDSVKGRVNGHIYNTINLGIRNMAGYGTQLNVYDRWAIVAYVRALQLSDAVPVEKLASDKAAQGTPVSSADVQPGAR